MATQNCVTRLLKPNERNTNICIFYDSQYANPLELTSAWFETINNTLGKRITENTNICFIEITTSNGYYANGFMTGKQLMNTIMLKIQTPTSIKISFSDWPAYSQVVILESELETQTN